MSRRCQLTGKRLNRANRVSHANNKTKRVQLPNLQEKRVLIPETGQRVRLRLSTRAIRTLNHKSLSQFLKDEGLTYADIGVVLPAPAKKA
jgi:large subunit ribosomal protein L28